MGLAAAEAHRAGGAGVVRNGADDSAPAAGTRSIVSTSNATPAWRRASVTASAGDEGSAAGNLIVTR
jgi:hypothetical protein